MHEDLAAWRAGGKKSAVGEEPDSQLW